jgi:hypothetical protein
MPHLSAALFRLERSRRGRGRAEAFAAFTRGLGGAAESADLRRDFAAWARRLAGGSAEGRGREDQEDVMLDQKIREMFEDRRLEGVAEGRKEGEVAGRKQGEVEVLVRLLERKFGPLDEVSRARLAAADSERLLGWAERVLTAGRLAEVFAD